MPQWSPPPPAIVQDLKQDAIQGVQATRGHLHDRSITQLSRFVAGLGREEGGADEVAGGLRDAIGWRWRLTGVYHCIQATHVRTDYRLNGGNYA